VQPQPSAALLLSAALHYAPLCTKEITITVAIGFQSEIMRKWGEKIWF
jgi:hypothetical protein